MHSTELKAPSLLSRVSYFLTIIAFTITFSVAGNFTSSAEISPLIKMIELTGNKRISSNTILARMKSKEGTPFSKNTVQDDIKKIYGIGYFDDIRVDIESFEGGVKLIYIFVEKPAIISLDFQGNKEFEPDKLREQITLTTGAIANLTLITDNAKKIVSFYESEGYWLAKAVPIIREVSEDSVAVTFQIEEGPEVGIDEITIKGNETVPSKDIKKAMTTKEWWMFSFLTNSNVYKEDQVRADTIKIKELYQSKGYIYIAVSEPEVALGPDRDYLFLTISVSEGDQYKIGEFKFKDNTVFSDTELYENAETASGEIFNRTALKMDIDKIIDLYMDKGYARADVNPLVDVNKEEKLANITLAVTEGGIFRIGRIDVTGNLKTRDKVVRREMRLDEGDIFNKSLLKRSYQRINNLNYFESVDIKPTPRLEDQLMDIDVTVKEKLTGMLSLGGGYSSVDKFMVMGEITQTNLFGRGLQLKLKADFSSRRTTYNIALTDPWFMNKPISASIGLYNEIVDYTDYDKRSTGGYIGFGKELSEYVGANIRYSFEQVSIADVSEDASSLIREQEGSKISSSISPSIWRDTRDNYLDPSTGSKNALYTTVAGLGGDNYFYKGVVDSLWFFPVIWDTTFSARGRYGYARGYNNRELPLYERFYVGGINTIRGLGFGEGGPKNAEGEKIGGTQELIFNFEYIFPLIDDIKLKGVIFFDYGCAYDKDYQLSDSAMRKTAGAGFRWISPLGPIRVEWGYNLNPKKEEGNDKVEFSVGGFF